MTWVNNCYCPAHFEERTGYPPRFVLTGWVDKCLVEGCEEPGDCPVREEE